MHEIDVWRGVYLMRKINSALKQLGGIDLKKHYTVKYGRLKLALHLL